MSDVKQENPAWHGFKLWFSHTSTWTAIFGCMVTILMIVVPRWAGMGDLIAAFDNLAPIVAAVFGILVGGQKIADGISKGKTSAYNKYIDAPGKDLPLSGAPTTDDFFNTMNKVMMLQDIMRKQSEVERASKPKDGES